MKRRFPIWSGENICDRQFGLFGEPTVHVLRLNMALDALH